jgi:hypothetical protein
MRRALFAVLALLLVTLQHEALVHPLVHLGSQSARPHDTSLAPTQAADTCIECALLAAGGTALGSAPVHVHHAAPAATRVAHAVPTPNADTPAWFHSRAPPIVL